MADRRVKKSKKGGKKKGEDSLGNDVRLHKADNAHVSVVSLVDLIYWKY